MIQWLKHTCFSNLELDGQKNRLFLFMMVPLILFAECNITFNLPFLSPLNLKFLLAYLILYGFSFVLIFLPALEKAFKYLVITGMLIISVYQLWLFSDFPVVYQIMYINLALALIYLDGALVLYTGLAIALFTLAGFLFWKDIFFPQVDIRLSNIPIILTLQTTLVLWGVTKIGVRFQDYIDQNVKMKRLLHENEQQLLLIHEKNQALAQYAKQVEQLAVLEERNRMARELHDTMGHTLTSLIAGLEVLKHTEDVTKVDSLLLTARKGLEEVRTHVHQTDQPQAEEPLPVAIQQLADEFADNASMEIQFRIEGEPYPLAGEQRLTLLRCAQEALTNAVRHGKADRIRVQLSYGTQDVRLRIEDNGVGNEELTFGFGLQAMQQRIERLHGTLQVTSGLDKGLQLSCILPVKIPATPSDIRLLLVEDQALIAESFSILLGMESDFNVMGIAGNGEEAIRQCEQETPDVILMDVNMPVMNGIEATRMIKERWPQVKVVILTTFQDVASAAEAISLGAEGFLLKSVPPKQLAETIRVVREGGGLISMEMAKMFAERHATEQKAGVPSQHSESSVPSVSSTSQTEPMVDDIVDMLSPKEIEILTYMAEGLKYKEIAQRMNYSEGTVKNYVSNLYSKLCVENRMQAVNKAHELHIL